MFSGVTRVLTGLSHREGLAPSPETDRSGSLASSSRRASRALSSATRSTMASCSALRFSHRALASSSKAAPRYSPARSFRSALTSASRVSSSSTVENWSMSNSIVPLLPSLPHPLLVTRRSDDRRLFLERLFLGGRVISVSVGGGKLYVDLGNAGQRPQPAATGEHAGHVLVGPGPDSGRGALVGRER